MWKSGDRVLASKLGGPHLYPGTVQFPDGDKMDVAFDDGEDARLSADQARPLTINVGDRVEVRLPATRTYTPATVTRRDGDRLSVEFAEGEQEWTSLGMVRVDPKQWKSPAPRPREHAWIVGDRVLAQWSGDTFWYPGTVQGIKGELLHIYFDDGGKEELPAEKLVALDLQAGDRVFGRWQGGPIFYAGKIARRDGEKIDIQYDDGDRETTTVSMVRVRPGGAVPTWTVGQRVLAQWLTEPFFYPGVIQRVEADVIHIQFDDGDRGQVLPEQVVPLQLKIGDRVYARWQRGPHYYPARIERINGDDLLVRYDDGQQEWSSVGVVRVLPQELTGR